MPLPPVPSAPEGTASVPVPLAKFTFAMVSDKGRVRNGNEDFCAADPSGGLFVVCDGMGGAAAGEVASKLAAEAFLHHLTNTVASARYDPDTLLRAAIGEANGAVYGHARQHLHLHGMGTTLVALVAFPRGALWLVHVGDSRCYRMRDGQMMRLTRDHSLVEEQILAGQLTEEQAERSPLRNIITRAVGAGLEVEGEIVSLDASPGDLYLLASDGLTRELSDAALATRLAQAGVDLEAACRDLVGAANDAGGNDNITVLLLRVLA